LPRGEMSRCTRCLVSWTRFEGRVLLTAMNRFCPTCGGQVAPQQRACPLCFTEMPVAESDAAVAALAGGHSIAIPDVSYVGGLPGMRPSASSGVLELSDARVEIVGAVEIDEVGNPVLYECALPTSDITAAAVEGPEQVERRVTATRLFLVGIFAFAWKKSAKRSYLVIECATGVAIFECRSHTPMELRARLGPWLNRFRELSSPPERDAADDPSDRLRRLATLHAEGLVTEEEFSAKRAEIIGEL
jgi:Short C-terminal domain